MPASFRALRIVTGAVMWAVSNVGTIDFSSNPNYYKIQTVGGFILDDTNHAGLPEPRLSLGTLGPGQTMRGFLAYDVPSGQTLKTAFFQAAGTRQLVIVDFAQ